jgi:hypothetical protein
MSQHNAAVTLVNGFGVTFEDIEELLDDCLIDSLIDYITITDNLNIVIADSSLLNRRLLL